MRLDKQTAVWLGRAAAVTLGVYLAFRFLLPLLFPFLLALLLAVLVQKPVRWLRERLHLPPGLAAGLCVTLVLAGAGFGLWKLAAVLLDQGMALLRCLPEWLELCLCRVEGACGRLERQIALAPGSLSGEVRQLVQTAGQRVSEEGLGLAMRCSLPLMQTLVRGGVAAAFAVFAAVLLAREGVTVPARWKHLPLAGEVAQLGQRLKHLAVAWVRCELLAMLLTCLVCALGIWLTGNPYALVLGLLIGVLDALPLIGSGLILLPWALVCLLGGQVLDGVILAATYGGCYLLRQALETRMMGESLGVSPLATLIAMYVGLQLFGLIGLFLGPAGWLLIRELVGAEVSYQMKRS